MALARVESMALRRREWMAVAVAAVLLRMLICIVISVRAPLSLHSYARLYDGQSYIISAEAMGGNRSEFNDYHGRVFPGFPALVALVHLTGLPLAISAIGIDWMSAALAAVLAAMVFKDRRVGWAMVMLIPHYLMNSAMALSEAPLLAFTLGGIWFVRRRERTYPSKASPARGLLMAVISGVLLGIAGWMRPMACFALLGIVLSEMADRSLSPRRRWIHLVSFMIAGGVVVLGGLALLHGWRGSALAGLRYAANSPVTYGGNLFTWPFHALLMVPIQQHVSIGRIGYMWAHALVVLFACGVMMRRVMHHHWDSRDLLAAPWLWMNTLFALCIGSVWGFECFHRFTIPAMPAMFWAIRSLLPRRLFFWTIIAAVSTLVAVLTILHDLPG